MIDDLHQIITETADLIEATKSEMVSEEAAGSFAIGHFTNAGG